MLTNIIWLDPVASPGFGGAGLWEECWLRQIFSHLGETIDFYDFDLSQGRLLSRTSNPSIVVTSLDRGLIKSFRINSYLHNFRRHRVILFHLSDERRKAVCFFYGKAVKVFRNYQRTFLFHDQIETFPLGATNRIIPPPHHEPTPVCRRDLIWSFAGSVEDQSRAPRREMILSLEGFGPSLLRVKGAMDDSLPLNPADYCQTLERSLFAPAPRGHRSLDTFRAYEACLYGAIPVIVGSPKDISSTFSDLAPPFLFASSWAGARTAMEKLMGDLHALQSKSTSCHTWIRSYPRKVADSILACLYDSEVVRERPRVSV